MDRGHKDALAAHLRELAARRQRGARRHARRRVRRAVGGTDRSARRRRARRRRADRRGARRRLVLRHPDGPDPRRRCALLPEEGAALLRGGGAASRPATRSSTLGELARGVADRARPRARRGLRVVRADASDLAGARAGGDARGAGGAGADRVRADPQRQADHGHRAADRLRARRRAGVRGRRGGGARQQRVLRPGAVDAVADVRVGARSGSAARCSRASPGGSSGAPRSRSPAGSRARSSGR